MWELYGMWAWIALILGAGGFASLRARSLSAFVVISVGAIGCIWAGVIADCVSPTTDRVPSRTRVIRTALAASLLCCLAMPLSFGKPVLVLAIALVWGISIIADSAQFSAITTEVIDGGSVATALAMQTATGFLITAISIQTVAAIAAHFGWRIAVLFLAAGPIVGLISTSLLRRTRILEVNSEFQASVSPNS
jgi:MFS family permease